MMVAALSLVLLAQTPGQVSTSAEKVGESPRTFVLELKLGPYTPLLNETRLPGLGANDPGLYTRFFNNEPMLMGELGLEYMVWKKFGTLTAGASVAYAEKFKRGIVEATKELAEQSTGIRILTIRPTLAYRFDWAAMKYNVPLVPYVKAQFVVMPWWYIDGNKLANYEGVPGQGITYGAAGTVGLSFMLDFLDQRLARDFDSSIGVNHTYLFAEFNFQETFRANPTSLNFSSRHWLFGIAFDL
ncbi:MAG: MXAN_2562 family outer membrane beta-barrel protein [Myxococcaceae bacterium]|nr:MXAN_2562 family outer membrane beta-barrel protein [Myxococcaceae bacterium]